MNVCAVIAEYNPFHNGHLYHLKKAKEITDADHVVVIMSGDYVQRGEPALFDKYTRAKCALLAGTDLVIELPVCFSTAAAPLFAEAAVSILNSLGVVDCLCFGSECADIKKIESAAGKALKADNHFDEAVRDGLKEGLTYPAAVSRAEPGSRLDPNDILAKEYVRALIRSGSAIKPFPVKRIGSQYNDEETGENFPSALSIRKAVMRGDDCARFMPDFAQNLITSSGERPLFPDDFSRAAGQVLLTADKNDLIRIADITESLANKIINRRSDFKNLEEFAFDLKTKDITLAHVKRALIHTLLGIDDDLVLNGLKSGLYVRILGLKKGTPLLSRIKRESSIPVISKLSDGFDSLSGIQREVLSKNIEADSIRRMVYMNKYGVSIPTEFESNIVTV